MTAEVGTAGPPAARYTRLDGMTPADAAVFSRTFDELAAPRKLALRLAGLLAAPQSGAGGHEALIPGCSLLRHGLETATRAFLGGEDEDFVVAALLHDIGELLAPVNHGEVAGDLLKPYISERVHWAVANHEVFQFYHYAPAWGVVDAQTRRLPRQAALALRQSERRGECPGQGVSPGDRQRPPRAAIDTKGLLFRDALRFSEYDQQSFGGMSEAELLPLSFFLPMLYHVLARPQYWFLNHGGTERTDACSIAKNAITACYPSNASDGALAAPAAAGKEADRAGGGGVPLSPQAASTRAPSSPSSVDSSGDAGADDGGLPPAHVGADDSGSAPERATEPGAGSQVHACLTSASQAELLSVGREPVCEQLGGSAPGSWASRCSRGAEGPTTCAQFLPAPGEPWSGGGRDVGVAAGCKSPLLTPASFTASELGLRCATAEGAAAAAAAGCVGGGGGRALTTRVVQRRIDLLEAFFRDGIVFVDGVAQPNEHTSTWDAVTELLVPASAGAVAGGTGAVAEGDGEDAAELDAPAVCSKSFWESGGQFSFAHLFTFRNNGTASRGPEAAMEAAAAARAASRKRRRDDEGTPGEGAAQGGVHSSYSRAYLPMHTDGSFLSATLPPRVKMLATCEYRACEGGQDLVTGAGGPAEGAPRQGDSAQIPFSLFTDGLRAVATLEPSERAALRQVHEFHAAFTGTPDSSTGCMLSAWRPVLGFDGDGRPSFVWNAHDRKECAEWKVEDEDPTDWRAIRGLAAGRAGFDGGATLDVGEGNDERSALRRRSAHALERLEAELEQKDAALHVRLGVGRMVLVDNWRVLHGREVLPDAGQRRVAGADVSDRSLRAVWRELHLLRARDEGGAPTE